MIEIAPAGPDDVDAKVALEERLFAEDSGVHEPYGDTTWPAREGAGDFHRLLTDPNSLVLIARDADDAVGLLIGYHTPASATRRPVRFATLRSLYVIETHRRHGVGRRLTERFADWARAAGCVEVHVDHYAANDEARRLYESCGFSPRSVTRVLPLG